MGRTGAAAIAALLAGTLMLVATAGPVTARAGDVQKTGTCSVASTWTLSAGPRDAGLIKVEFEVDQNVAGQTWRVRLADNGTVFFRGLRVTQSPSGSFTVTRRTADLAGTDRIVARARNVSTGELCVAAVKVR